MNNAAQKASYLVNFAGQCPFLGMVNSRPISSTTTSQEPRLAAHTRSPLPSLDLDFEDELPVAELKFMQQTVENEIEKEFHAKKNGSRYHPVHAYDVPEQEQTKETAASKKSQEVFKEYDNQFASALHQVKREGRYRVFAEIERKAGKFPEAVLHQNGKTKPVTVWCSNDYLGQGQNPVVVNAFKDAIDKCGAGAGGTRNISGTSHYHVALERELSDLHQKEASLLFSSGYVANEATISTIAKVLPDLVIFSDQLNHASLIAGIKSAGCEKRIFKNNDVDHLHSLMKEYPKERPKLVVFESVYSMEGNIGPLAKICDVADEHKALTMVDEVHAVGLYGERGAGVAERDGVLDRLSIISGTLAKGFGVGGGYIASSHHLVDAVRSFAPGFIFTTSLNPPMAAAAQASVAYLKNNPQLRVQHQERAGKLKKMLKDANLPIMPSSTHIVPVFIGDAAKCKQVTDDLLNNYNIYVQPINYPTVPKGEERLRLTPSPFHTDKMMDHLVHALKNVLSHHTTPQMKAAYKSFLTRHAVAP